MGKVIDINTRKSSGGNLPPVDENEVFSQRHEDFCLNVFSGLSPRSSAFMAGFDPTMAKPLLKRTKVKHRIECLREQAALRAHVTVESLLNELEEARTRALAEGQISAAVNATMVKAKMLGFLDQERRGDSLLPMPKPASVPTEPRELTIEEWNELFAHKALR